MVAMQTRAAIVVRKARTGDKVAVEHGGLSL